MNTNQLTEEMSNRAQETAENLKDTAETLAARATARAREAGAMADFYVREYAWTSLALVAVTAGFIGFLLGRRDR